jgi:hypothetical protein
LFEKTLLQPLDVNPGASNQKIPEISAASFTHLEQIGLGQSGAAWVLHRKMRRSRDFIRAVLQKLAFVFGNWCSATGRLS